MNLIVRGKNIPITDSLRDYVEKRIFKMERFLGEIEEAQATLSVEKDRHRVEVTIPLNGFLLRGEEETGDMYSSVDLVMDKLEKQVEKYKTKLIKKIKSRNLVEIVVSPVIQNEEEQSQIIRTKRFAIKPMTVEEAVMQMNLIGHSFFVFSNAESEEVNVVYRRKDGHYGLIEPEF
ncbi:MAG: ribosome-associated translation inhibitor RaiA [Syntrophomonadaceae bacterium]|nr:ribosome-associated translation inhibitor RaiA [Syntrophomonadaceae bacterium]